MKLFVIYHDDKILTSVGECSFFSKHNLRNLDIGKYQQESLAENRFLWYLSQNLHLLDSEYIGIAAASWNTKYKERVIPLHQLSMLERKMNPNLILAADITSDWHEITAKDHPHLELLVQEICSRNNFLPSGMSFWSNNFICHVEVMKKFLNWWQENFIYFFDKYGVDPPFKNVWGGYKSWLHAAYFYERLTTVYFANLKCEKEQIQKKLVLI